MTAFNQAFALLKADTGMWDEIYAPLLAETTGMGDLPHARHITDFVPTKFAVDNIIAGRPQHESNWAYGENTDENYLDYLQHKDSGDHGHTTEQLMESILESGFDTRGADRSGRADPTFEWSPEGINQYEGRHRLLALDKLGAPHVPYMGYNNRYAKQAPHLMPLGEEFKENVLTNREPYSLGEYMDRSWRQPTPPSFMYGRELVPGMGRLLPFDYQGNKMNLLSHIDDVDIGVGQKWMREPSWKVTHDE